MALAEGLALPEGRIAVFRPPAAYVLPWGPERARIVHGFRPDVDRWRRAGYEVSGDAPEAATAVVVVPRSRALAQDLIGRAGRAPLVIVDGQKTDGVDALFRACRARLGDLPSVTRAHGRLFWFSGSEAFDGWTAPPPERGAHGFFVQPGVFSEEGIDRGSALLAEALPARLPARLADLGAGWGYLAARALEKQGVTAIDLVEAESRALDCARLNLQDPRARFVWADATTHAPEEPYDGILCNPPFHAGRKADPALGRAFIAAAARMLTPRGRLWLVANRHLPYEAALRDAFAEVTETGGDAAFKLFEATRPRRR